MVDLHGKNPIRYTVSGLCRLFGFSKQAYYKAPEVKSGPDKDLVAEIIVFTATQRDLDPRIGCRKLWHKYTCEERAISRRLFEDILAANSLMLRMSRKKTRTTDSTHGLPVYPNLIYSVIPDHPCQIWVSDITYVPLVNADGTTRFCYLSIVMDAYSRYILGYYVGHTLETIYSIIALNKALETCHRLRLDTTGLIHHSDRGVQYASKDYVKTLEINKIGISMTENGNPKDNPQAERINSTVKNELLHGLTFTSINDVMERLPRRIDYYNTQRPHMSLDYMTPLQALRHQGEIKKRWHSYRDAAIAKEAKKGETGPGASQNLQI